MSEELLTPYFTLMHCLNIFYSLHLHLLSLVTFFIPDPGQLYIDSDVLKVVTDRQLCRRHCQLANKCFCWWLDKDTSRLYPRCPNGISPTNGHLVEFMPQELKGKLSRSVLQQLSLSVKCSRT